MKKNKLYNIFIDLISKLNNEEIQKLIDSLQEYIKNEEE